MSVNWKIWVSTNPLLKLQHATYRLLATEQLQANDRSNMDYSCKVLMQNFSYKSQTVKILAGYSLVVMDLPHTHGTLFSSILCDVHSLKSGLFSL